ncbi:MAG: PHP domain-containing protein [Candidatus Firestonebacteria bacterium]|nr:PHP domain-containing protein [Candidatus Firestonebacteria bacterium]
MKIDMHVHSIFSGDSTLEPRAMINRAKEIGLNAICITDHHSFLASQMLDSIAQKENFKIFRGAEYHTSHGHLLVFGIYDDSFNSGRYLPIQDVIDKVQSDGGIAIPSHPYHKGYSHYLGDYVFKLKKIYALEIINAKIIDEENEMAQKASKMLKLPGIGSSDAHSLEELGKAYTVFDDYIGSMKDLIEALKNGRFRAEISK